MKDTAFIQLGAWERIYGALARALGVSVSGGDKSTLPDDGTTVTFDVNRERLPFTVTVAGENRVAVAPGCVLWGGLCLPLVDLILEVPPSPWIVWIEMRLTAITDGSTSLYVERGVYPVLDNVIFQVRSGVLGASGTMTEHCTVTETAGVISQTSGVMRWPLACSSGAGVRQMWTGHLILEMEPNGRIMPANVYPVEGE